MTATMSRAERSELGAIVRKRERVMKAAARERSTQLLAEFDAQSARIYEFDDDEVWRAATNEANEAVAAAQQAIAERCRQLGIPPEFAPSVSFNWYGRGENAVASRRAELRRMAKSRIEAIEQETITKIEALSLSAQTEIVITGLESAAARTFLEKMPSVEALMPAIDVGEPKALIESRHRDREAA